MSQFRFSTNRILNFIFDSLGWLTQIVAYQGVLAIKKKKIILICILRVRCISTVSDHERRYKCNVTFTARAPLNTEAMKEDFFLVYYCCFSAGAEANSGCAPRSAVQWVHGRAAARCLSPSQRSSCPWELFSELIVQNASSVGPCGET